MRANVQIIPGAQGTWLLGLCAGRAWPHQLWAQSSVQRLSSMCAPARTGCQPHASRTGFQAAPASSCSQFQNERSQHKRATLGHSLTPAPWRRGIEFFGPPRREGRTRGKHCTCPWRAGSCWCRQLFDVNSLTRRVSLWPLPWPKTQTCFFWSWTRTSCY